MEFLLGMIVMFVLIALCSPGCKHERQSCVMKCKDCGKIVNDYFAKLDK